MNTHTHTHTHTHTRTHAHTHTRTHAHTHTRTHAHTHTRTHTHTRVFSVGAWVKNNIRLIDSTCDMTCVENEQERILYSKDANYR